MENHQRTPVLLQGKAHTHRSSRPDGNMVEGRHPSFRLSGSSLDQAAVCVLVRRIRDAARWLREKMTLCSPRGSPDAETAWSGCLQSPPH
jgi:hypothetical protein